MGSLHFAILYVPCNMLARHCLVLMPAYKKYPFAGFPLESKNRTYVRPGVKFWTYTKFLSTITPGVGLLFFSRIHNRDSRTVFFSIINTRILQFQGECV